ncbi:MULTISPECIES: MarR family winged helix-turn-helix transcriptional regulator [Galbibacter]|uniref:MarR family transcriptional regulator n=1 Tax=Galbibacter pacificus TaxID=2996052 RepID=A0ABT6FWH1_9FLAO|nr:MarR family transcriptional regulator [Galbibacter pacificus]MDG3584113.1 MarR family transcriptional regulator [Galbibacter pacificus]MDG3587454.1 MarR family transcriptional regulator [Galbibacter pacificus]
METTKNFSQISRAYSDTSILMHEAIARKVGLSGTDHKYLGLIIEYEEMTAGKIAEITGLTTGSVTGLIDRLEKKKLVRRKADKNDRRKVLIVPNVTKIMGLLQPIFSDLQRRTQELIDTFSDEEINAIIRYFLSATEIMKTVTMDLKK